MVISEEIPHLSVDPYFTVTALIKILNHNIAHDFIEFVNN